MAPEGVEATILAIFAMIHNFCLITLPELIGALINNKFVHMTKEDMGKYDILIKV